MTAWGWIHLILGVVAVLAGFFLFAGRAWASAVAIAIAVLSAILNFFFIPYYPWWSLLDHRARRLGDLGGHASGHRFGLTGRGAGLKE